MAIPGSITAEVAALASNVTQAAPLQSASRILLAALRAEGAQTLTDIEGALANAAGALDAVDPTGFPGDMVGDLLALAIASEDQTTLSDMRGLVGRAVFNISQAGN